MPQVIYEFWSVATRPANVNGLAVTVPQAARSMQELLQDFALLKGERLLKRPEFDCGEPSAEAE